MNMPREIYMRDDGDEGIEITSERDHRAHKYILCAGGYIQRDSITALCSRLQSAAIKCDTFHIFAGYAPHVSTLDVRVRNKDHNYAALVDEWEKPLLDAYIYLNQDDAVSELISVIDQLQRMGVEV